MKASDYSVVMDNIAADHFRAAGIQVGQISPELDEKQIAALREFAERQPLLSGARKEFAEAAQQAERGLQEREARETSENRTGSALKTLAFARENNQRRERRRTLVDLIVTLSRVVDEKAKTTQVRDRLLANPNPINFV